LKREKVYVVSDTGSITMSVDASSYERVVKLFESQGYRLCSKEVFLAKRRWQRQAERLSQEVLL